jgi:hypothetical protein
MQETRLTRAWFGGSVLLAAMLLFCAACAARQVGAGGRAAAPLPGAQTLLTGLPPLPLGESEPPRQSASNPIYYPLNSGASWYSASPAAFEDNGAGVIPASGENMAFALYEVQTAGCQLQELLLDMTVLDGAAWVALPNYHTGQWELDGPLTVAPPAYNMEDPRYYSPQGRVYFGLIAWDGAQVKLISYKRRIESGDALLHKVADVGSQSFTAMANIDGGPAIAFHSQTDDALYYARPTVNPPASAGDWVIGEVDSGAQAGMGCDLGVVDGKPVIAYARAVAGDICFAYASSAEPSSPADWDVVTVALTHYAWPSMAIVTGQPMLAFYESDPGDADTDTVFGYLCIATHSGADFQLNWNVYRAADSGAADCGACINAYNGIPAVCFVDTALGQLNYGRATVSLPSSAGEWNMHAMAAAPPGGRTRLLFFAGVPAVAYRTISGNLSYAWGLSTAPASVTDWHFEQFVTSTNSNSAFDIANINGLPTILYQHSLVPPYVNINMFRFFDYDYDMLQGDYTIAVGVDGGDNYGPAYSLIGLDGQPAFCYYVPDGQGGGFIRYGRIAYETGN